MGIYPFARACQPLPMTSRQADGTGLAVDSTLVVNFRNTASAPEIGPVSRSSTTEDNA